MLVGSVTQILEDVRGLRKGFGAYPLGALTPHVAEDGGLQLWNRQGKGVAADSASGNRAVRGPCRAIMWTSCAEVGLSSGEGEPLSMAGAIDQGRQARGNSYRVFRDTPGERLRNQKG